MMRVAALRWTAAAMFILPAAFQVQLTLTRAQERLTSPLQEVGTSSLPNTRVAAITSCRKTSAARGMILVTASRWTQPSTVEMFILPVALQAQSTLTLTQEWL